MSNERHDLFLFKKIKQDYQILSKEFRFESFECLDAVRDQSFPTGQKPASDNI